jgi:voltage-gated potassium channel
MSKTGLRAKIYYTLEVSEKRGDLSWWTDVFIMTLIGLNVGAIVLESVEEIRMEFGWWFNRFELFSVVVFSIEYILRAVVANENPKYQTPILGNVRYLFSPLAIIDLLAILPFFLPFAGIDLRVLRMLRMFRLFRLFKFARYIKAFQLIDKVFEEKREALAISLMLTLFLLLMSASLMYYVENPAQPDKFSSIPQTMWWGIATLTTVGYGDVYPITGLGKVLGGVIAIVGVGLFALPAGILASGFSEQLGAQEKTAIGADTCPHCGRQWKQMEHTDSHKP